MTRRIAHRPQTKEEQFWGQPMDDRERSVVEKFMSEYRSPTQLFLTKFSHEWIYATRVVGCHEDDLEQSLYVGLLRAARRFDESMGGFSTYAMFWMRACFWQTVRTRKTLDRRLRFGGFDAATRNRPARDVPEDSRTLDPIVVRCMGRLPKRTREILKRRFGIDRESETLESISLRFGITRERVRQIQSDGLERMRRMLERSGYE